MRVRFDYPSDGWPEDRDRARFHLKVGQEYTVTHREVGAWYSTYEFKEVPGVRFNTIQFTELED